MADRAYHRMATQGVNHVEYNFSIKLTAGGVPNFASGDKVDSATGSYMTLADTGTGVITVTTVDKFLAVISCVVSRSMATPTGDAMVTCGLPSQDATTKKWSIVIKTWTNSAGTISAADMVAGDLVNVHLVLRNSAVTP